MRCEAKFYSGQEQGAGRSRNYGQALRRSMNKILPQPAGLLQIFPMNCAKKLVLYANIALAFLLVPRKNLLHSAFIKPLLTVPNASNKVLALVWIAVVFYPMMAVSCLVAPAFFRRLRIIFYFTTLKMAGIKLDIRGDPYKGKSPVLYAANHISYLDILALGRVLKASFIAKQDVKSWPFFNVAAIVTRTMFILRKTRFPFSELCVFKKRLYGGESLVLFPEGTTSTGNEILKFKSSLFRITEEACHSREIIIQPVAIAYTEVDGVKTDKDSRTAISWYGDTNLLPHLWYVFTRKKITISLSFLPPLVYDTPTSRKIACGDCKSAIEGAFRQLIA